MMISDEPLNEIEQEITQALGDAAAPVAQMAASHGVKVRAVALIVLGEMDGKQTMMMHNTGDYGSLGEMTDSLCRVCVSLQESEGPKEGDCLQ